VALIQVVDASVVIALLDPHDRHHAAARRTFDEHAASTLVLPASAYAETLVRPAQRGLAERVIEQIARVGLELAPIDGAVAEIAAALRAQHPSLRLPDALVLACGDVLDAEAVWTADERWPSVSARARLIGAAA
jgi:predicted nucleic acid-binding protein